MSENARSKNLFVCVCVATMVFLTGSALAYYQGEIQEDVRPDTGSRIVELLSRFHNVNRILLRTSNIGFFGSFGFRPDLPSAQWPPGVDNEYLYAAGLWVGGVVYEKGQPESLVSAAVYQLEYRPKLDVRDRIYMSSEGQPGGGRNQDDDNDGLIDEDPLDGYDNDGDGLIDEDYEAISQQMFTCVYYDTVTSLNAGLIEDFHKPLGIMVRQESYAWTSTALQDFIGVEYVVTNISNRTIYKSYVGFMVDADIGPVRRIRTSYNDDMAAFIDTTVQRAQPGQTAPNNYRLTIGYMYDYPGGDDGDVPGYIGVMFLGYTDPVTGKSPGVARIHAFRRWSSEGEDPRNDRERYRYLRGNSDYEPTIDPPTVKPLDYRFLVSAGPFDSIPPDKSLKFQVAFVIGHPFNSFIENATNAQMVYNGALIGNKRLNWVGSSPPPCPRQRLIAGDGKVIIEWDDFSERTPDPLLRLFDFAGYRIWRAVGWRRESQVPLAEHWKMIADIPKSKLYQVYTGLEGIGRYRYVDEGVHNGLPYWYAVVAYDDGSAERDKDNEPIPRYGSYSQAMQLIYPRAEPAQTYGKVTIVPNPYPWNPSNPSIPEELRAAHRAIGDLAEYEREPSGRRVTFFNLPRKATVRIYTLTGDLIWERYFEEPIDPVTGAPPQWNLVSRNNQEIVSGIYIVHIDSPKGTEITKFVVVR
ncbi:MAG: T9SS type A sorting domain-containing protein [bacterium]